MSGKPESLLRTEVLIAHVLRYGVLLCLIVIGIGLALRMFEPGNAEQVQAILNGQSIPGQLAPGLLAGLRAMHPDSVIALGLLMLIALPILRVALTTILFFRERDWAFFAITLVVLCVLLFGVIFERIQ